MEYIFLQCKDCLMHPLLIHYVYDEENFILKLWYKIHKTTLYRSLLHEINALENKLV